MYKEKEEYLILFLKQRKPDVITLVSLSSSLDSNCFQVHTLEMYEEFVVLQVGGRDMSVSRDERRTEKTVGVR